MNFKKEKQYTKKKLKAFQKYKTTPYGYYLYLIEKKLNICNDLNYLKFFIDKSGKLKSNIITGLSRGLQKSVTKIIKHNRSKSIIKLSSLKN
jgi:ribosomal protein S18